jgi:hypothetical protein
MNCKVTREYLSKAAGGMLNFLKGNKIESVKDLDNFVEKEFPINKENNEMIMTALRPSELGTRDYTISYIAKGNEKNYNKGIVLELKINKELGYIMIIAKNQSQLKGYDPFATDPFDNIIQNKRIATTDIAHIKSELSDLIAK